MTFPPCNDPSIYRHPEDKTPSQKWLESYEKSMPNFKGGTQLVPRWKALRRGVRIWPRPAREDDWDPERKSHG